MHNWIWFAFLVTSDTSILITKTFWCKLMVAWGVKAICVLADYFCFNLKSLCTTSHSINRIFKILIGFLSGLFAVSGTSPACFHGDITTGRFFTKCFILLKALLFRFSSMYHSHFVYLSAIYVKQSKCDLKCSAVCGFKRPTSASRSSNDKVVIVILLSLLILFILFLLKV